MAELSADDYRKRGIDVRYSPMDCTFQPVAHAHASLLGMTRQKRRDLLPILERGLSKLPG